MRLCRRLRVNLDGMARGQTCHHLGFMVRVNHYASSASLFYDDPASDTRLTMADSETMGIESVKVMNTLLKQADSTNIATRSTLPSSDLKDLSASLILKNRTYQQQYANVYFVRLMQLRKAVMQAAVSKFPGVRHVERVLDVQQGQPCFVIGTLYLEMPLKPNILDDITKEVPT